jgi:hypothetical protein
MICVLLQFFDVHYRQGFVCIWNNVCLERDSLFRKLSCFVFGDSFEVPPEISVQRFFRLELDHFHQPWISRKPELSLSTNSDSPCSF